MHSLDARGGDPLAHLKEQFAELMDDLHGSKNDPDTAAVRAISFELIATGIAREKREPALLIFLVVSCCWWTPQTLAWKKKLLYGNAKIKSPEGKLAG